MAEFDVPLDGDLAPVAEAICALVGRDGDVHLHGPIGAGKTALVASCARRLGVREPVTSPTFALAHRYAGAVAIAHLDLYRLEHQPERDVDELVAELDAADVGFVEWPELGAAWLPPAALTVTIAVAADGRRRFAVEARR